MVKEQHVYDKNIFLVRVVFSGILAALVFLIGIHHILRGSPLKYLWLFVCFLSLYTISVNFISLSYPRKVVFKDNKLIFSAFNREHIYNLDEIKKFKVKERHLAKKMYIRINNPSLLRGRYWIDLKEYSNYKELNDRFLAIEAKVHPNSLKAKIKKNNLLYTERNK